MIDKEQERKRIGQRIKTLRTNVEWKDAEGLLHKGMTQGELAERAGLQLTHISRIEAGKYSIGIDTLTAIIQVFGKRIDFADLRKS